jgi:arginine deiminase
MHADAVMQLPDVDMIIAYKFLIENNSKYVKNHRFNNNNNNNNTEMGRNSFYIYNLLGAHIIYFFEIFSIILDRYKIHLSNNF